MLRLGNQLALMATERSEAKYAINKMENKCQMFRCDARHNASFSLMLSLDRTITFGIHRPHRSPRRARGVLLLACCCLAVSGCATCGYKTASQQEQETVAKAEWQKLSFGEKA